MISLANVFTIKREGDLIRFKTEDDTEILQIPTRTIRSIYINLDHKDDGRKDAKHRIVKLLSSECKDIWFECSTEKSAKQLIRSLWSLMEANYSGSCKITDLEWSKD
jgi:predicted RNA-binding protein YlxR (DUF448 family)